MKDEIDGIMNEMKVGADVPRDTGTDATDSAVKMWDTGEVFCPHCDDWISIDDQDPHLDVRCPLCWGPIQLPPAEPAQTDAGGWLSAHLFQDDADQGCPQAQFLLGRCYQLACGVERDLDRALELFHASADQGFAQAQLQLAECYLHAIGVDLNITKAVEWLRKAAAQGHSDAQCELAHCLEWGRGVPEDRAEALLWYRAAADQGSTRAQDALRRLETQ